MSEQYHQFSDEMIAQAVDAARLHGPERARGVITAKAECIDISISAPTLCLRLPFDLGDLRLTLPQGIKESQTVRACLDIVLGPEAPVGARITVQAGRTVLVRKILAS